MLDGLGLAETTPGPLILVANSSASWRATAMAANPRSPPGCSAPRSRYGRPSYPASCGSSWARLTWSVSARTPASHGPLRLWLPDVSALDVEAMLLACLAALLLLRLKFGIAAMLAICTSTALVWFSCLEWLSLPSAEPRD